LALRKARITSCEAVEVGELNLERGAERRCANDAVEAGVTPLDGLQGFDDVLWPAGEKAAGLHRISMVDGLRKRPRAGLALPCSPCFNWSRSGISNSFDRKRAPVDGALMRLRLHCDYGIGVLSMPRVGATARPSAEPPPMPYFAMKSKARSEPLWIGCQHSTGSRSGTDTG
jgi:hypothetical protein